MAPVNKKIKILIVTDSAALQSGLATTTRNIFIPLLKAFPDKYEIHQLGFFHFMPKEQVPWPIYQTKINQTPQGPQPDMNDKYGEISFHDLAYRLKPDIVFGYGDMWHFNHLIQSPYRNTYRLITYYTIDGQPYFGHKLDEQDNTEWGPNLAKVDQIITLSHFGKDVLKASCKEIKNADIKVMYHPMEMQKFPYVDAAKRKELRVKLLPKVINPDVFVAGFVGRNQFRKQNHKLWEVLHYMVYGDYIQCNDCNRVTPKEYNHSARRSKEPDSYDGDFEQLTLYDKDYRYTTCWYCKSSNIKCGTPNPNFYMWLHMPKKDSTTGHAYNHELHERMWKVSNNIFYTENVEEGNGVNKDTLNAIMASWDCMFYPSGGEGFGNPPFEAMALGVPIVYSDYSSHAEFCKFGGLPVRVGAYVPELSIGINRAVIDTGSAIQRLLEMQDPKRRETLSHSARNHILQYDIGYMHKAWDSIFTEVNSKPLPIQNKVMYAASV